MGVRGGPRLLFAPDPSATRQSTARRQSDRRQMTKGPKSKQVTLIALAAIVLLMVPCFGVAFSGQGGESAIGIVFVLMGLIMLLALVAAVSGLTWLLRARRNTFG